MIKITKHREPRAWIEHRNTPGARYEPNPELRRSLLLEQGNICAYCMRRIDEVTSKIEHLKCQSRYPALDMQYTNMVACCHGNINNVKHCDNSKGDSDITFSLFEDHFFCTISYETRSGKIKSSNPQWDVELASILNLNNQLLVYNRKSAIEGVIETLAKQGFKKSQLRDELNHWKYPDNNKHLKEFCGIVIWYINKKLNF
jgi:uncharacterized protein (TIGR02646 family)